MRGKADVEQTCVNALRFLAADMIQQADSGHPGLPLGAAPLAYTLWTRHLKFNPGDPDWPDRDRFVLSAGHGSALLYALLHLAGYPLPREELRRFRRWGSLTPGHPEAGLTPGVELTTGPLGQGLAAAVGMAVAEAHLAAVFNRPGHQVVDHCTYVLVSDGDLMEGVAAEACSLAGHLGLGKLIVLYDDNKISLAGSTNLTFTEDVGQRFVAAGWHVQHVRDGNDLEAIDRALQAARAASDRPSLISVRTTIGYGAPTMQNTFAVHGKPLGEEELAAAKRKLGWPVEPKFHVPPEVEDRFRAVAERGRARQREWERRMGAYAAAHPQLAGELRRRLAGDLPPGWDEQLPGFSSDQGGVATRKAGGKVLQALAGRIPELIGGSADLNPSTNTVLPGKGDFQSPHTEPDQVQGAAGGAWDQSGRNLHFGVREHAMAAMANGLSRHGGVIPFCATFLVFSDYMRPAMRLAAMMHAPVVYVFTHDSVGVGEDGPTHQPVEQLMGLRTVPGLTVIRPADAVETVEAWRVALARRSGPTALVFTRQALPVLDRDTYAPAHGLRRGGYVLWQSGDRDPAVIIIGTGSEVHVALEAAACLAADRVPVRVVSLPSWELFEEQPAEYREQVLLPGVPRVTVEAGVTRGWERYVGLAGEAVGVDRFGASAPGGEVMRRLGITPAAVVERARAVMARAQRP
ncbi:MAG: transketolase [Candidatus Bipolaricaulaceae bacterium]